MKTKISSLTRLVKSPLFWLILLGFLIRFVGLTWGLPATLHNDESVLIRSALGMRFGDYNPKHFDWPTLYIYLVYFVFALFIKLRVGLQLLFGTARMEELLSFWWHPDGPFYYLGRFTTALFSTGNIVLTYLIAQRTNHVTTLGYLPL